jgi:hypothetical protein
LLTAAADGWQRLRARVFGRDGWCIATRRDIFGADIATDLCMDAGKKPITYAGLFAMEWDHVTDDGGIRRDDEAHGVTVCPWHHRGAAWRSDSSDHREAERVYLARLYPEAWPLRGASGQRA